MRGGLKAAALLTLLAAPIAATGQTVPITLAPGEVLMQAQGSGEAHSRPDLMSIDAGVVTTGQTARAAVAANNALASRLLDAVRVQGVAQKDVQTQELSVRPQFADDNRPNDEARPPRITGYIATNNLTLTLRDLDKAPDIVDALFAVGANNIQGPNFSLSHPEPAQAEARRAAVAAAREQAEEYASALGMHVSRVLRVSERGDFEPQVRSGFVMANALPKAPLEPGEITTTITVWIDFAMVPAR